MPDQHRVPVDKSHPDHQKAGSDHTTQSHCAPVNADFVKAPSEHHEIFLVNDAEKMLSGLSFEDSVAPKSDSAFMPEGSLLGRYRVGSILGQGSFGAVYLAEDEELHRTVAIKVPFANRSKLSQESKERYLKEARLLAKLDHPHIVPIYDLWDTENGIPCIVSKFIPGCTLGERIRRSPLTIVEAAEMVMRLAEALAYAHEHQILHRDIKPGNIALENGEKPYLIDFGLAERESDMGLVKGLSGTPAYMSPEQAKGENHLVDGRSDIYSLGVVFYELLVCEMPHEGDGVINLLINITKQSPRAPREIDHSIPAEINRIVLKCLAKKASDRYSTASELANDLRHWLTPDPLAEKKSTLPIKIVPKGLRSFDGGDKEFFLNLLPGTRDRDGLPDHLRFWKSRIEASIQMYSFRVGVIYGPSGCGKSSFVKAGLIPRLVSRIRVVYVEATAVETEERLLQGLERVCPDLPKHGRLRDAINHLRKLGDARRKVVLVIDQFEQWLHGERNTENSELENALRQCDGERVQCVVMVRDDYWLPFNRFMQSLEIKLVEGQNAALIDLFDLAHARDVLLAFGRAYGALPTDAPLSSNQEQFLSQAVEGLAQEGKVISVRLSLFAEMMKGRPWTPATLAEVGGADGIGVTFLEETFNSRSSKPEHRRHAEAARGVLRALLPTSGTDIKGHSLSRDELKSASDYIHRPNDFDVLMTILDGELRLITPTASEEEKSLSRYYQLTHDYLVPSLRDWLTRKQKETKQGRAELMLEDLSGVWNSRPENRRLPSFSEWIRIRRLIPKSRWTTPEAKMLAQAGRYYGKRLSVFFVAFLLLIITGGPLLNQYLEKRNRKQYAQAYLQKCQDELNKAFAAPSTLRIKELVANRDSLMNFLSSGEASLLREDFDSLLNEINRSLRIAGRENNDARLAALKNSGRDTIAELKILIQDDQKLLNELRESSGRTAVDFNLIEETKLTLAKTFFVIADQQNVTRQYGEARNSLDEAEKQLLLDEDSDGSKNANQKNEFYGSLSRKIALALADVYHGRGETNWYFFKRIEGLKDYEKELAIRLKFLVDESDPEYRVSQRHLARCYGFLGDAYLIIANFSKARENYIFAKSIRKKLAESEPADQIDDKCMHARDFGNFAYIGLYSGDAESLNERLSSLREGVKYYEDLFPRTRFGKLPIGYQFERIHRRLDLIKTLLDGTKHTVESIRDVDNLLHELKLEFDDLGDPSVSFFRKERLALPLDLQKTSAGVLSYFTEILIVDLRNEFEKFNLQVRSTPGDDVVRRLEFANSIFVELDVLRKASDVNYYGWAQIIAMQIQMASSQKTKEDLFVLLEDRFQKSIRLGFDTYHQFKRDRSFEKVRTDNQFQKRFAALEAFLLEREKAKEDYRKLVEQR